MALKAIALKCTLKTSGKAPSFTHRMTGTDFKDLDEVAEKVSQTAAMLASNAAHLARLLKADEYPGTSG